MSQSYSNNSNSWNTTVNVLNTAITNNLAADDRRFILSWLSPLEPRLRHQDIQGRRAENVGEWPLQNEEFKSWYAGNEIGESDNAVLFCYGDPGVGKTYISSLVIDRLCDQARGQSATVACFYFDFVAQKEQSPTSMLGALLKQLVCGLEVIPEEISQAYQAQKNSIGGRGPQLSDIVKMMQTTSCKKRTFICIDALDECAPGYRVKLLDSLNRIIRKSPGTRVFMTRRPHIRPEIGRCLGGRIMTVSISPKRDDIISYLHARLHEDTTPDAMDSSLEADILKKIPDDISEIFLLVSLNIDAILQETTIHRRRKKLNSMTDGSGLGDAYGATLDRIKGQGGEKARLGIAALMWISHSERPLKVNELCHALAVEIGSSNLDTDNIPSIGTLLACCQGLIAVDKEAPTVRLIHFTLQEYLRAHPELFGTAHSTMAETCLSYLNSQQVKGLSTIHSPDLQHTPFLEYSSVYWGVHAKRDLSDCAKILALKLLDDFSNHISAEVLLRAQRPYLYGIYSRKLSLFSGLHCASLFGIVEIVSSLVEVGGCDIDGQDCVGNTPLLWAVQNGHVGVVEILLGRDDVNPDRLDNDHRTPLYHAAWKGHEGVVEILLGRGGVSPDIPDNSGQTPLWWAAWNGREGVAKILLGRDDVDPDQPDNDGQTPLCRAAWNGHEELVKILLKRDVNPDKQDNNGRTPLWCAAQMGHEGVVKILLERDDVSAHKPDNGGRTPLYLAAWGGHEGAVKLLLGRHGVSPSEKNKHGETPLSLAAGSGHEGVVKVLLGRDDTNPDISDGYGRTPLWCATERGHEGVVNILLGRDDINPDRPDQFGRTPLWWAAKNGHEEVLKILLRRPDVNPHKPDQFGRTPLWCAAESGHEGVVKILLGRPNANPTCLTNLAENNPVSCSEWACESAGAAIRPPESATPSATQG